MKLISSKRAYERLEREIAHYEHLWNVVVKEGNEENHSGMPHYIHGLKMALAILEENYIPNVEIK